MWMLRAISEQSIGRKTQVWRNLDKEAGAKPQPDLLEPCAVKVARTVRRGAGTGDRLRPSDNLGYVKALRFSR